MSLISPIFGIIEFDFLYEFYKKPWYKPMQTDNYNLLIQKLDSFIRKFYINGLIRGGLYSLGLLLGLFLLFNILEYNFYFDMRVRKAIFWGFLSISIVAIGYWILLPLTKYFRLGGVISHHKAASIIGDHFTGVQDKLLNVLQLKEQESTSAQKELLYASIEQKTLEIKPVAFKSAIDLSKNRQYLKYALPPFLLFLGFIFMAPNILKDSTYRIMNSDTKFEREAPFSFEMQNNGFTVVQYQDYTLEVTVYGAVLPNETFIEVDGFQYKMNKVANDRFGYDFRNVQKDTEFRVFSGSVTGVINTLKILRKPNLSDFSIKLDYPGYIGRKDETLRNIGDVSVPEGTRAVWEFNTTYTDDISLKFGSGDLISTERKDENYYRYAKKLREDSRYMLYMSNQQIPTPDSISYAINIVKDQYPTINVEQFKDSTENNIMYFVGTASDDYKINTLNFHYTILDKSGRNKKTETVNLSKPKVKELQYDHMVDVNELGLVPGDKLMYYFQVSDNDAVNGSKLAKTRVMNFEKPTLEEFKEEEQLNEEEIKENLKKASENAKKMQEEFKKLREKLLTKKELDWQDKEELEKLLEKQQEIQEKLQKAKDKLDENIEKQEEVDEQKEEILEKQEKLQQMMEEALDPEKQELMDKIQELMQELEKDSALEMIEQFEMDNETVEKEMDRLLELFKTLEVEKEMKETIEKLEELAKKQDELAKETEEEKKPMDELEKEQEKLNEEMEEIEKKMEELEKKNDELERPKNMGDKEENKEKMNEIQEEQEESQGQMKSDDSKGASKSQKSAAGKMKEMAGSLQSGMESGEADQAEEDIKAIRQLLENLVTVSFDQEGLGNSLNVTKANTPKYVELVQGQFKLKDDFEIIEDSLIALSNRVSEIQSFVIEKVAEVKDNFQKSLTNLEERKIPQSKDYQRRTMTNLNDLALMLAESMDQMQQQAAASMPGSQMCDKPGGKGKGKKGGKEPSDKISDGQQGMQESLDKIGKGQKDGKLGSAKDFAQAAAKQAALRKALQDIQKDRQEQGKGTDGGLQEIIDEMNKIEIDLVNKKLNNETLKRQQDIVTRLLVAEKADRQREFDNKRKAEIGIDKKRELPQSLQDYLKKREAEIEMYKSISPELRPYYKYLVDKYYKALKSN